MEPTAALALGLLAAGAVALLAIFRWRTRRGAGAAGISPIEPSTAGQHREAPSGPALIRPSRIVVVGSPRPSTGLRAVEPLRLGPDVDVRRRLLRDASAVLLVVSLAGLAIANLPGSDALSGGVLGETGTPAPGGPQEAGTTTGGGSAQAGATPGAAATPEPSPQVPAGSPTTRAGSPSRTSDPSGPSDLLLALLEPCPDRPDCYLYTVRVGDNLSRIARLFGVPYDVVLRLNASLADPSIIHPGDRIVLPPPTR